MMRGSAVASATRKAGVEVDPPRLGRRGNPRPKLQEPGLGDVVGSFENLRLVAPELLA